MNSNGGAVGSAFQPKSPAFLAPQSKKPERIRMRIPSRMFRLLSLSYTTKISAVIVKSRYLSKEVWLTLT